MHQTPFPKFLAFVEGRMERLFINNNFRYVTVIPVSNGVSWTTSALAYQITTLYRAKNFNGDGIVVWIDREKRGESSNDIANHLRMALIEANAPPDKIHILISDIMVENIILSDEYLMREFIDKKTYFYEYEGMNGKVILSELSRGAGITYKETSVGVGLLKKVRLKSCATKSASVARFLETFDVNCWWLAPHAGS